MALVHRPIKRVHEAKGYKAESHQAALQAYLDVVMCQREDLEEELKVHCYSSDEVVVRAKVEIQAELRHFYHAKLDREYWAACCQSYN